MEKQRLFYKAIKENNTKDLISILEDRTVNASFNANSPIYYAHDKNLTEIVDILWDQKSIKDSLLKDKPDLYRILIKKDIKEKISKF